MYCEGESQNCAYDLDSIFSLRSGYDASPKSFNDINHVFFQKKQSPKYEVCTNFITDCVRQSYVAFELSLYYFQSES